MTTEYAIRREGVHWISRVWRIDADGGKHLASLERHANSRAARRYAQDVIAALVKHRGNVVFNIAAS